jgi:tetratricopeptide (TPR) repeat protein
MNALASRLMQLRCDVLFHHLAKEALDEMQSFIDEGGLLAPEQQISLYELQGQAYLQLSQYQEASEVFQRADNLYLQGYALLLKGEHDAAYAIWQPLLEKRPNHWCGCLQGMATFQLKQFPTFLQIRNFLESDIVALFEAGQLSVLKNILAHTDFMADIHYEAPKYVGRAFLNVGEYPKAQLYLLKAQKLLPNDPEAYFHLAQLYVKQGDVERARLMLNQCLLISPAFYPGLTLMREIE